MIAVKRAAIPQTVRRRDSEYARKRSNPVIFRGCYYSAPKRQNANATGSAIRAPCWLGWRQDAFLQVHRSIWFSQAPGFTTPSEVRTTVCAKAASASSGGQTNYPLHD